MLTIVALFGSRAAQVYSLSNQLKYRQQAWQARLDSASVKLDMVTSE